MPKKESDVEYEILQALVMRGALYPMELVNASPKIKKGSVYVYLTRLRQKKWVSVFGERAFAAPGASMRRYKVTGLGAARHHAHVGRQ
jgi:hypothetical protein